MEATYKCPLSAPEELLSVSEKELMAKKNG